MYWNFVTDSDLKWYKIKSKKHIYCLNNYKYVLLLSK